MEPQHRDAPAVFHLGVQVHVVLVAREDFAETAHADEGAGMFTDRFLELPAESGRAPRAIRKDREATPALEAVAADESGLFVLQIPEARHIDSVRTISECNMILVPRDTASGSAAHTVIHEVVSEFAAGISQAIGEFWSRRVKQNPRRFQC